MVSIIIPNHGRDLTQVLDAIKKSTYKKYEVIVVDEGLERSKQRNIGINRANGEYFLFLDSDMVIEDTLLSDCMYLMKFYDALYIPEVIMTKGLFGRIRNWERQFYTNTPIDAIRFVKREYCPYFDETMNGPEDSDWDRRITGTKGISNSCFYHYEDVNLFTYLKKKAYYAKSMELYRRKYPNDKILDWKWRCINVFLENGKWKVFIRRPHYALATILLILCRGIIYVTTTTKKNT